MTWPIYADNQPIKSGLLPERNATLKVYNWVAYVNPQSLKNFGKKYNCQVEVTDVQHDDRGAGQAEQRRR